MPWMRYWVYGVYVRGSVNYMNKIKEFDIQKNKRRVLLERWVNRQLDGCSGLVPLTGDAGFRCYYRLQGKPGLLAVDAPPETEDTTQFVKVASLMAMHGVTVPRVLAADIASGFLLVEDWGPLLLGKAVADDTESLMYPKALMALLGLQQVPLQGAELPLFDAACIRRELDLFPVWFVESLLGYQLPASECAMLESTFGVLQRSALAQPQVMVHRDFHSRNILVGSDSQLALIDFQDAVSGPFTYDLVSLLRDCYLQLPASQVERWALAYGDMATAAGVIPVISKEQYLRWFDWMGLQRHIKVLGVFARLHLRDSKSAYLQDLPLVIHYVIEVAGKYTELQAFTDWFVGDIVPLCEKRAWYAKPEGIS